MGQGGIIELLLQEEVYVWVTPKNPHTILCDAIILIIAISNKFLCLRKLSV